MKKTRILVFSGILIAMYIVLNMFLDIPITPSARIRFTFLPLSFSAGLFGPILGGIVGAVGDFFAWALSPKGPYFPGLTISAFISGTIYGLFLYKKPKSLLRITLAALVITVFIDLGLNTYWMTILYGKGFFVLFPARLLKSIIMFPTQIFLIYALWRYAGNMIENHFIKNKV